jgi:hypothetical protein
LLRKKHLKERYGYSYRHLDRLIDQRKLPPPRFPFGNSVETWFEDELDEWDTVHARHESAVQPAEPIGDAEAGRRAAIKLQPRKHGRFVQSKKPKPTTVEPARPRGRPRRAVASTEPETEMMRADDGEEVPLETFELPFRRS